MNYLDQLGGARPNLELNSIGVAEVSPPRTSEVTVDERYRWRIEHPPIHPNAISLMDTRKGVIDQP